MGKNRLEAFSDGVLAIVITIMVLELKVPHGAELAALKPLLPVFVSYVLSFIYLGIYWNNHHHLLHSTRSVSGGILWANLHVLFWLSLFPFSTAWMGENHAAPTPTAAYGFVLLMAAIAYYVLQRAIVFREGRDSRLALALGRDWKGKLSPLLYLAAIPLAFVRPWIAHGLYAFVALLWLIPDRRIEREFDKRELQRLLDFRYPQNREIYTQYAKVVDTAGVWRTLAENGQAREATSSAPEARVAGTGTAHTRGNLIRATVKGISMGLFGFWVVGRAVWHFAHGTVPEASTMGLVGLAALLVNALLFRCSARTDAYS